MMGKTILPIIGWTEKSSRADRNVVKPNNQIKRASPQMELAAWSGRARPPGQAWRSSISTDPLQYQIEPGREAPVCRRGPLHELSREDVSLSLHRRIGSRLRFQEYLQDYRTRLKEPKTGRVPGPGIRRPEGS